MQTREQQYAAKIYEQVKQVPQDQRDTYKSTAQGLPILIRTAGLAQAISFTVTQGPSQCVLLQHLAIVVSVQDEKGDYTPGALLQKSITSDLGLYMHLTQKVLDALLWYKRFSQALFEEKREGEK